ncbi:uncharacterized protein Saf6 [Drosophila tropicalis]|uniref:uncharacterized protein Saf6 n=1 Tax=Drosophila tropicalis TaxID=46794 RepID=UPI0035AC1D78
MRTPGGGHLEETSKSSSNQTKVSKKSTKSRSKSAKLEASKTLATTANAALACGVGVPGSLVVGVGVGSLPMTPTHVGMVTTPTTPTSSLGSQYNQFDASFAVAGAVGVGPTSGHVESNTHINRLSHHHTKAYAGFDPRSIKIYWEQHDQTDVELSQDVCARLAEDATYKVWELINNVKIYSRHSAGIVTYDLVNEVLKDADVPPMLGAMDSDWDRIDYDGTYFFHSDKIFELREEFQKDIELKLPNDVDFHSICPAEERNTNELQQFLKSLITASLFGDSQQRTKALNLAFESPLMGSCYRALVSKILQMLAFRQEDALSQRCWRLLRSCNFNPMANQQSCRQEYFHLAEILISQLMGPFETIKVRTSPVPDQAMETDMKSEIKMELEEDHHNQQQPPQEAHVIYQLQQDDDMSTNLQEPHHMSHYFASPVASSHVPELCQTIGQLAAQSGYLQAECLFLIKRRLARFFEARQVSTERDFKYISRSLCGLMALGEYAFREFIPYIYQLNINDIPDSLWIDLSPAAMFLSGSDDIYLYEWLEHGCGVDRLQPFMVYFANIYQKWLTQRFLRAKKPAYRVDVQPGVRRLEWSSLAAAMCHGDDPNNALKPKPQLRDAFPELVQPNLHLNCGGIIKFKFSGCRPRVIKPKTDANGGGPKPNCGSGAYGSSDILIARRKLLKPMTNVRRVVAHTGYHYLRI